MSQLAKAKSGSPVEGNYGSQAIRFIENRIVNYISKGNEYVDIPIEVLNSYPYLHDMKIYWTENNIPTVQNYIDNVTTNYFDNYSKKNRNLQNKFENDFVSSNSSVEGIANSLARYHMLYGDTNLINNEIDIYRSITREEIKAVANKYLNANQRLLLEYLPEPAKE